MTKKDANWRENQLVQSSDQKIVLKGELLIWRTKNQARDQGTLVQLKDSISNQSKLVPRKVDSGPSSKVGLSIGCSSQQQQQQLG